MKAVLSRLAPSEEGAVAERSEVTEGEKSLLCTLVLKLMTLVVKGVLYARREGNFPNSGGFFFCALAETGELWYSKNSRTYRRISL